MPYDPDHIRTLLVHPHPREVPPQSVLESAEGLDRRALEPQQPLRDIDIDGSVLRVLLDEQGVVRLTPRGERLTRDDFGVREHATFQLDDAAGGGRTVRGCVRRDEA